MPGRLGSAWSLGKLIPQSDCSTICSTSPLPPRSLLSEGYAVNTYYFLFKALTNLFVLMHTEGNSNLVCTQSWQISWVIRWLEFKWQHWHTKKYKTIRDVTSSKGHWLVIFCMSMFVEGKRWTLAPSVWEISFNMRLLITFYIHWKFGVNVFVCWRWYLLIKLILYLSW